jgi:hypothetical protein
MILRIIDENRRLRQINAELLSALKDIATGCGKSVLSREAMRAVAFDAIARAEGE